ncbi:hypothetical protein BGW41_007932 [Actinomortierella wolfii]|nr:hypothetical protein BGW41_007932 [Actinomortierella wolfii]
MQALTPILINLLFPRSSSPQAGENEPSAFSAGYLDSEEEYNSSLTRHDRRLQQARRHHSTGARYGRLALGQLYAESDPTRRPGATSRENKRMSLDSYGFFDAQPLKQQQQSSSQETPSSFSSFPPLASPDSSRTLTRTKGDTTTTGVNAPTDATTATANSHHQRRPRSIHSHRGKEEQTAVPKRATSNAQPMDSYYQPGDEHEHLAESEWVNAAVSSPRPSTCSMTSSFSSSSSYSSLCEPLTPTSASYSHYHSNDHFRKQSPLLQNNSPYALSSDKEGAGQPYFVNLASHQWTALEDD